MNWLNKLAETYDSCESYVGKYSENNRPLLPLYHNDVTCHLEITIDEDGNFITAEPILKDNITILGCTDTSIQRSSDASPYAINDQLQYIAGDLIERMDSENCPNKDKKVLEKAKVQCEKRHKAYCDLLQQWYNFDSANKKLKAVINYIEKKCIISDLLRLNLLLADDNGMLILEPKVEKGKELPKLYSLCKGTGADKILKAACRFNVLVFDELEMRTFSDSALTESWIRFQNTIPRKKGLCCITGEITELATSYPRSIRYSGDGLKLISGNGEFSGYFDKANESFTMGNIISMKAHSALKWLISRQGCRFEDYILLAWSVNDDKFPQLLENNLMNDDLIDEKIVDTAQARATRLNKSISGVNNDINPNMKINIIALDATNSEKGRLSLVYNCEMDSSDYLERLKDWYNSCCWEMKYFVKGSEEGKGKYHTGISTPTPLDIAFTAYGRDDKKMIHSTITRVIRCIIDGTPIPYDIVTKAVSRTSNRVGYKTKVKDDYETDWNKGLQVTCALYRKFKVKENYSMALDTTRTTRDYLYGRLLAVAESIESWALNEAKKNNGVKTDSRITAAARYFSAFEAQPYRTWAIIEKCLKPYIQKLGGKATNRLKLIGEIMDAFKHEDFTSNKKLSGEFLLGYYNQRTAIYAKTNIEEDEGESENE